MFCKGSDASGLNGVGGFMIKAAAGLSPFAPDLAAIKAGRLMLEAISDHVRQGESFAFETTLAGLGYARTIPKWRVQGFGVKLIFLSLPDPESAMTRVAERVAWGGHAASESTIRCRFAAVINVG
jgi:predicted ABC-type ATPase